MGLWVREGGGKVLGLGYWQRATAGSAKIDRRAVGARRLAVGGMAGGERAILRNEIHNQGQRRSGTQQFGERAGVRLG